MIDVCIIDNGVSTLNINTRDSLHGQENEDFVIKELNIRDLQNINRINIENEYVLFLYSGTILEDTVTNEINKIIEDVTPDWVCFRNDNVNNNCDVKCKNKALLNIINKFYSQTAFLISKKILEKIKLTYNGLKYYVFMLELAIKAEQVGHGYFYEGGIIEENINRTLNKEDNLFIENLLSKLEEHIKNNPGRYFQISDNINQISKIKEESISIICLDGKEKKLNESINCETIVCNRNDSYYNKCLYGINKASSKYLAFVCGNYRDISNDDLYSMIYLSSLDDVGAISPIIKYKDEYQYTGIFFLLGKRVSIDEEELNDEIKNELTCNRDTYSLSSNFWVATKDKAKVLLDIDNAENLSQDSLIYKYTSRLNDSKFRTMVFGEIVIDTNKPLKENRYDNYFKLLKDYKYKFAYDKIASYKLVEWIKNNRKGNYKSYLPIKFNDNSGKRICILSHELSLTGAPIVLLEGIKLLLKNNYQIFVYSLMDGPLRYELLELGIPVIILNDYIENVNWDEVLYAFDYCLVNTVVPFKEIEKLSNTNKKVIWWLHDAKQGYEEHLKNVLPKRLNDNIKIYAVSEYAKKACTKYRSKYKIDIMPYGIKDISEEVNITNPYTTNKKVFLCIGTIEKRKGQDVLLDAIELLPDEIRNNCLFVFVGKRIELDKTKIFEKLTTVASKYPNNIEYIDKIDHDTMLSYIKYAYAVVCPSKDDPLPTVMTETMMLSNICICSENTGTASLINNGKNGYLYKKDSPKKLVKCIIDCYNTDNHDEMKKEARQTYLDNFTLDVFENNLLKIFK